MCPPQWSAPAEGPVPAPCALRPWPAQADVPLQALRPGGRPGMAGFSFLAVCRALLGGRGVVCAFAHGRCLFERPAIPGGRGGLRRQHAGGRRDAPAAPPPPGVTCASLPCHVLLLRPRHQPRAAAAAMHHVTPDPREEGHRVRAPHQGRDPQRVGVTPEPLPPCNRDLAHAGLGGVAGHP